MQELLYGVSCFMVTVPKVKAIPDFWCVFRPIVQLGRPAFFCHLKGAREGHPAHPEAAELTSLSKQQVLIGDDTYRARLPFVRLDEQGQAVRAIKPLSLAHDPKMVPA